jgi:hypothetical protein
MTAEIEFPDDTIKYRIIECGIDKDVYDEVKVNGEVVTEVTSISDSRKSYDSGWMEVSARPDVEFENHVDPDGLRDLSFQKQVLDENNNHLSAEDDKTLFSFRLYLSNGVTDNLVLADMVKYGVQDPKGYLCHWNADEQKFVPSRYKSFSEFDIEPGDSDAQKKWKRETKESLLSDTSMNGSISKIPAWYTVVVPDIPVGTKFKFEERFSETPIGYGRTLYDGHYDTYIHEDGEAENEGRVRASQSPVLNVINKRGFGLQANKVWSDKAYTKWHETIYTAIYVGNSATPLEGSIREMVHPSTYVRYFIEDVVAGASIDDYRICEVKVTNPVVDEDGVVTSYSSLQKVGNTTDVEATGIDSDTPKEYTYTVSYEVGTPEKSIPELNHENTRTDTITNTRAGGIVFTLYDMYEREKKLSGGLFTLERYNEDTQKYEKVGSYVSDSNGRVTIFYDFEHNVKYRMTETESPKGYIGLPNGTVFTVDTSDNITISGNDPIWQNSYPADHSSGDLLTGYVDLYNKPYTIEVYKYDGEKTSAQGALKEAYFDLYKGIEGFGGIVKDYIPLYKDLETRPDGYIPSIDTGLEPGTYYLTEKAPPDGYVGLDGDVIFEITPLGELKLKNQQTSGEYTVELKKEELNDGRTIKYYLNIPNTRDDSTVNLTVRKLVSGNMGNKAGQFSFTFETESGDTDEYQYVKKNLDESVSAGTIRHGETFTLTHGDEIKISVPIGTDVRVSEETVAADGYTTTVSVDYGTSETANSKTIESIDEDTVLTFTNTRESLIPTGVWMPVGGMVALALVIFAGGMVTVLNRRRYREYL